MICWLINTVMRPVNGIKEFKSGFNQKYQKIINNTCKFIFISKFNYFRFGFRI